jgi:carboxypeptidase C (cathepsin A)
MRIRGMNRSAALLALLASCGFVRLAEATPPAVAAAPSSQGVGNPAMYVTHHQVSIGGTRVAFTVNAGETYLYTDGGELTGSIFSYSYVKDASQSARRPVLFLIGGGPGSASYMLNVGFVGPWAVAPGRLAPNSGAGVVPPFELADNPNSLLDVADLVFIDPIGTGYSRAIGAGKPENFWGIDEDLESLAQFIQLWLSKNNRWDSPKFFMGESYGGTRAAIIPNSLMGGPSYPGYLRAIALNGVIVLVNSLGWPLGSDGIGTVAIAATGFPNQAAAAWYHQKIDRRGRSLQSFYEEASKFASTEYLDALHKEADRTLTDAERTAIQSKLTYFTGLPNTAFQQKLALSTEEFSKLLLADRGLDIGTYDSRFTFPHGRGGGDPVADDAALSRSFPVLTGAFLDMQHSKLKVDLERPFAAIKWRELLAKWNFHRQVHWTGTAEADQYPASHGNDAEELAVAMVRNDKLYAMIATGYYDMLMTPAQAQFTAERAGIPKDRLVLEPFEAGHEPYVDAAVAKQLANDIRAMIRKASR